MIVRSKRWSLYKVKISRRRVACTIKTSQSIINSLRKIEIQWHHRIREQLKVRVVIKVTIKFNHSQVIEKQMLSIGKRAMRSGPSIPLIQKKRNTPGMCSSLSLVSYSVADLSLLLSLYYSWCLHKICNLHHKINLLQRFWVKIYWLQIATHMQ